MKTRVASSFADVDAEAFDAVAAAAAPDNPFLEHAFFLALEASGSIGKSCMRRLCSRPPYCFRPDLPGATSIKSI